MLYGWFGARGDDALNPCASCSCELPRSANPAVTGAAVTAVLLVAWLMSVILLSLLTVYCRRNRGLHRENESFCLQIEKLRCQMQKQEDELISQQKQLARQHVDEMTHLATRCITAVHRVPSIVMSFKLAFGCIKRYITAIGKSATTVIGAVSTVTKGDDALNPCASCSCELPRSTNPAVTGVAVTAVLLVAWLMSVILLSLLTVCCRRNRGLHRENEYFCLRIEKLRCQLQKQEDELITQRKQLARQHVDEMKHLATRCITAVHGAPNIVTSFKLAFGCIKRYITAVGTSATTVTGAISTITKCCMDAARCIHRPIDAIINSASSVNVQLRIKQPSAKSKMADHVRANARRLMEAREAAKS
ncbi:unnamed protein product [Lampetra fluviatilis]